MMLQTYRIVSHVETDYRPKSGKERSKLYYNKQGMCGDIAKVMRQWFNIPDDDAFYAVFVAPGKFEIHGLFRFDPDILHYATQRLDELVFKAAEKHGVWISGWISFVSTDVGYEMAGNWKEIINAYLYHAK